MNKAPSPNDQPTYVGVVYPWQCDHMGHMNVMWYVSKFDEATWHFFARFGVTQPYMDETSSGMAALEQTINYKREVVAGTLIAIHTELVEVKEKTVRFRHRMTRTDTAEEVATCTLLGVHMDRKTRKSKPFPEAIATVLAAVG